MQETPPAACARPKAPKRSWPTAAAFLLPLPWALWALVRGLGLETGFPLVPMMAFTPYAAVTTVLPAVFALLARRWLPVLAAVLVAAAFTAFLLPRAIADAPPSPAPAGPFLRVLTLNTRLGAVDPRATVALVRSGGVDLLSVQELTPSAAAALEDAGLGTLLPHAVLDARTGASGGGLYSRYPLTPAPGPSRPGPAMPRAGVEISGAVPVEVVSVHPFPPLNPAMTRDWARYLADLPPADHDGAVRILAGDFNATLDHTALRDLVATGYTDAAAAAGNGHRSTWPDRDGAPGLVIDHILADARTHIAGTGVHRIPGTDHRALSADIILPAARPLAGAV